MDNVSVCNAFPQLPSLCQCRYAPRIVFFYIIFEDASCFLGHLQFRSIKKIKNGWCAYLSNVDSTFRCFQTWIWKMYFSNRDRDILKRSNTSRSTNESSFSLWIANLIASSFTVFSTDKSARKKGFSEHFLCHHNTRRR